MRQDSARWTKIRSVTTPRWVHETADAIELYVFKNGLEVIFPPEHLSTQP